MTNQQPSAADWRCPFCNQAAEPDAFGRQTHLCTIKPSDWIRERAETFRRQVDDAWIKDCLIVATLDYLDLSRQ